MSTVVAAPPCELLVNLTHTDPTRHEWKGCVACSTWVPMNKDYPAALGSGAKDIPVAQFHGAADEIMQLAWGQRRSVLAPSGPNIRECLTRNAYATTTTLLLWNHQTMRISTTHSACVFWLFTPPTVLQGTVKKPSSLYCSTTRHFYLQ